ncbi:flagellar filament capping protein FliD [Litorivicinus sp.]|nr:flagellar filament capping protein FliD [Litorivicinus sp.]
MVEVDFLGALGAGSDIDTKSLVQSLVDAERAPKEASINSKIAKSESQISAYGRVVSALGSLSTAFSALNDASDFADFNVNVNGALASDGSTAYSVEASSDVEVGITDVVVTSVATRDRWASSTGYAAATTALNGGNNFSMTIEIGSVQTAITVTDPTPTGVMTAVNAADIGISASLVDTGMESNPYKLVLSGDLGASNAFSITDTVSTGTQLDLDDQLSTASNAELEINGVEIERTTNEIDDAITGITLTLSGATASSSTITVERDTSGVKSRIEGLVNEFNTTKGLFRDLSSVDSGDELAGVFSGNSSLRLIAQTVTELITTESSTTTDNVSYLSDIGLTLDRYGDLQVDDDILSAALSDNFSDVITLFSADTDNQTTAGEADRGLAGDAIQTLTDIIASDGTIMSQSNALGSKVDDYQDDLEDLDRRMSQIYQRYLAQFTVMEQQVDQLNSTRDYLKTALENLPFSNKNS